MLALHKDRLEGLERSNGDETAMTSIMVMMRMMMILMMVMIQGRTV